MFRPATVTGLAKAVIQWLMNDQRWIEKPVAELAAVILPWFGSSRSVNEQSAMMKIAGWLTTGSDREAYAERSAQMVFDNPDLRAVAEAMQVLERACLLMRYAGNADFTCVGLIRLGMHALETNTVHQHLGLGDAPPVSN